MNMLFMKKENRDRVAREILQRTGIKHRKSSIKNQLLHPQYVEDWPHTLSDDDYGFGNTIYKTHFSMLYILE